MRVPRIKRKITLGGPPDPLELPPVQSAPKPSVDAILASIMPNTPDCDIRWVEARILIPGSIIQKDDKSLWFIVEAMLILDQTGHRGDYVHLKVRALAWQILSTDKTEQKFKLPSHTKVRMIYLTHPRSQS